MQAQGVTLIVWKKCRRKKWYPAYRQAEREANRLISKGEDVHVYECPICGRWHVGHKGLFPPNYGERGEIV